MNNQLILTQSHVQLLKDQFAKDLTPQEFELFIFMAKRFRLDPLARQLTPTVYNKADPSKRKVNYITTIDGLRLIAFRTNEYDGKDAPIYTFLGQNPETCTVTVYKKGTSRGFSATVYFNEYRQNTGVWPSKPKTMIAKVAEAHALRMAFPQELSGLYTSDEMPEGAVIDGKSGEVVQAPPEPEMITKDQAHLAGQMIAAKHLPKERVQAFLSKAFGKTSFKDLTHEEAEKTLTVLDKLPSMKPPEPVGPDAAAEDIFSPTPTRQASVEIDLDEVDAGIERQRAEGGL